MKTLQVEPQAHFTWRKRARGLYARGLINSGFDFTQQGFSVLYNSCQVGVLIQTVQVAQSSDIDLKALVL